MKLIPSSMEQHLYTTPSPRNSSTVPLLQAEHKRKPKEDEEAVEEEEEAAEWELYESIGFDGDYIEPNPVRAEKRTDKTQYTSIYVNT